MGEQSNGTARLYMQSPDGTYQECTHIENIDISDGVEPCLNPIMKQNIEGFFDLLLRPVGAPRCKTRKRFKKMLMSIGISRNTAEEIARGVSGSSFSYSLEWAIMKALFLGGTPNETIQVPHKGRRRFPSAG